MEWTWTNFIVLLFLSAGVFQDLQTRTIKNQLTAVALVVSLAAAFASGITWMHVQSVLQSFLLSSVLSLSFFALGVWGGGDGKMMIAISPLISPADVMPFFLMAFLWAAIFSLAMAVTHGRLFAMGHNLGQVLFHRTRPADKHLTRIPFSVGILFGYLALIVSHQAGHYL